MQTSQISTSPEAQRLSNACAEDAYGPYASLPQPLAALALRLRQDARGDALRKIFRDLTKLLDGAARADEALLEDRPPEEALDVLASMREEGWRLAEFIRALTEDGGGLDAKLRDALDGATYALRHELRRVFDDELSEIETLANPSNVKVQLAHATDLLRSCFQQTTVTLAQVFDPSLDGSRIFNNNRDRFEQSLALAKELWVLAQRARRALREHDCESIVAFVEGVSRFRRNSMHLLMYKDWHDFESHVARVLATRSTEELLPVLAGFERRLAALLEQVRRRAVLLQHANDAA